MKTSYIFLITVISAILFSSCGSSDNKKNSTEKIIVKPQIIVPVFNEDSAYYFIEKQVNFGPRVPNTKKHQLCADYLMEKMQTFADTVILQQGKARAYNGTILNVKNIIAVFNPNSKSRVLLCAHWDTRPYADYDPDKTKFNTPILGANDGASGVGVLMEIARQLKNKSIKTGIDIIFFDAEDYGKPRGVQNSKNEHSWALGSQLWSRTPHKRNYLARYGILLDMVGAKGATFTKEGTSMYFAPGIMNKVWKTASSLGYQEFFLNSRTSALTDDHLYINEIIKIPTIDIIHTDQDSHTGFFPHWHTTKDDMSNIDKNTLKAVGQTLLEVIYKN